MASEVSTLPLYNYFDNSPELLLQEREYIYDDKAAHQTSFKLRPIQARCARRPPRSLSNIEIKHKLRTSVEESCKPEPSDAFRMWVESGRRAPPFPPSWDAQYNSNVWRNFSHGEGYKIATPGRRVKETIAAIYPVAIPSHSEMGDHTFTKFLSEVPVIRDTKKRHLAIAHSMRELQDFQRLKLRSQMRVPPMDMDGNIAPPEGFVRHERRFNGEPHSTVTTKFREMNEIDRESQRSKLGTHMTSPNRLWKISFKDNHPEYEKVIKDTAEKKALSKQRKEQKHTAPLEIYFK